MTSQIAAMASPFLLSPRGFRSTSDGKSSRKLALILTVGSLGTATRLHIPRTTKPLEATSSSTPAPADSYASPLCFSNMMRECPSQQPSKAPQLELDWMPCPSLRTTGPPISSHFILLLSTAEIFQPGILPSPPAPCSSTRRMKLAGRQASKAREMPPD